METSWTERVEYRIAELERRLAALEAALGDRPGAVDELVERGAALLAASRPTPQIG